MSVTGSPNPFALSLSVHAFAVRTGPSTSSGQTDRRHVIQPGAAPQGVGGVVAGNVEAAGATAGVDTAGTGGLPCPRIAALSIASSA